MSLDPDKFIHLSTDEKSMIVYLLDALQSKATISEATILRLISMADDLEFFDNREVSQSYKNIVNEFKKTEPKNTKILAEKFRKMLR